MKLSKNLNAALATAVVLRNFRKRGSCGDAFMQVVRESAVIVGRMVLGILFVSRICVAREPSAGSISLCVALGLGSLGLGMAMLRVRRGVWRLAVSSSAALTAVTLGLLLQPEFVPGLVAVYALTTAVITLVTIFGAISVGTLNAAWPKRWAS